MKNCLTQEELMLSAWKLRDDDDDGDRIASHLAACGVCRERVKRLRAALPALRQQAGCDDERLAAGKQRLLASLAPHAISAEKSDSYLYTLGAFVMRHRISVSTASAVSLMALLVWTFSGQPSTVMAQATKAIREATSYRFEMLLETDKPAKSTMVGAVYWLAPGSYRMEMRDDQQVDIKFRDAAGLGVNHKTKQYWTIPAQAGRQPGLMLIEQLGKYSGEADRQLGVKQVAGVAAQGFEIAAKKIDSGIPQGEVTVWLDQDSHLPVLVETQVALGESQAKLTMHKFSWNTELDKKLFDTTPPEGYVERKPSELTVLDRTEKIVAGLRLYARAFDGEYPRGKMVYGDITSSAVRKKLGITANTPRDAQVLADFRAAQHGYAHLNTILRDNPDAAYFGEDVTARDKDKLLLYWRTKDAYQVLFGDLTAKSVSAKELKRLKP